MSSIKVDIPSFFLIFRDLSSKIGASLLRAAFLLILLECKIYLIINEKRCIEVHRFKKAICCLRICGYMADIFDNIAAKFEEGLTKYIQSPNIQRVDFCVGYFNLRGWKLVVNHIDSLPGTYVDEDAGRIFRTCRLLIGMHKAHEDYISQLYGKDDILPDAELVQRCKLKIATDFRKQLLLGLPSNEDEWTLRRLSAQMKAGKVTVKLFLGEALHAKLYVMHKNDYTCPRVCLMGSSNLTFAGLTQQGELNASFTDKDATAKFDKWFCDRWEDPYCID